MAYEDLNTKFVAYSNSNPAEVYPIVSGINSVKQGLERLLTTPKGHNPFNREYGSTLQNLLFENEPALSAVQMFLYMDITKWEPRITLSPAGINIERLDANTFRVSCNFTMEEYDVSSTFSTVITKE